MLHIFKSFFGMSIKLTIVRKKKAVYCVNMERFRKEDPSRNLCLILQRELQHAESHVESCSHYGHHTHKLDKDIE